MSREKVRSPAPELTELQLKCLEGFWNRRSAKQIAAELGISEAWVNKNLMAARRLLNVNSSADAAAIVFGGKRGSIKNYYYQETDLISASESAEQGRAGSMRGTACTSCGRQPVTSLTQAALSRISFRRF